MSRPPDTSTRKSITLPDELWDRVSDFRFAERVASEAEALRRLVQSGLLSEEDRASELRASAAGVTRETYEAALSAAKKAIRKDDDATPACGS